MDDRQFDSLSRRIAALTEPALQRRGLLRGLTLAGIGGALSLAVLTDGEAKRKNKNKKNKKNKNKKKKKKKNKNKRKR